MLFQIRKECSTNYIMQWILYCWVFIKNMEIYLVKKNNIIDVKFERANL